MVSNMILKEIYVLKAPKNGDRLKMTATQGALCCRRLYFVPVFRCVVNQPAQITILLQRNLF